MEQVHVNTVIPGPRSRAFIERAQKAMPLAQYIGLFGIMIQAGHGSYVTDMDGNTFLDFLSGASAVTIGYGNEEVIDAYARTAAAIQHSCSPYSPNEYSLRLAEKLIEITPGTFEKRVLFGMSGSDAVDAAIKIARKYTARPGVVSFRQGYHGSTGFSMGANGFGSLQEGLFVDDCFHYCDFPRNEADAERALETIESYLRQGDIAAVIIEAIQGDGGNVVPPQNFHQELLDLTHQYGAVFVCDEVQSGAGRSGRWYEIETFGVVPDIITTAKGLSSGYAPISACIARAEMADTLAKGQHLFTFSGHPPSCAAALKVIEIIERDHLMENAVQRGEQFLAGLRALTKRYEFAREARGRGLHIGFEVYDDIRRMPLGGVFAFRCLEKGLYPGYFGVNNEVMRLHPTLIVTPAEIDFALQVIGSVVEEWDTGTFPEDTLVRYRKHSVGLGTG